MATRKARRTYALRQLGRHQHLDAGYRGEGRQGAVERLGRDVEAIAAALRLRGLGGPRRERYRERRGNGEGQEGWQAATAGGGGMLHGGFPRIEIGFRRGARLLASAFHSRPGNQGRRSREKP
ncbi:hypothetical protein D9M70_601560 [compost metagenome]